MLCFRSSGDSKEKRISGSKSRRRNKSRSRSPKETRKDESGLGFDPTNLDKVRINDKTFLFTLSVLEF